MSDRRESDKGKTSCGTEHTTIFDVSNTFYLTTHTPTSTHSFGNGYLVKHKYFLLIDICKEMLTECKLEEKEINYHD